ncbi:MAG: YHS domain-containing (seleno)protein [Bacteroidota bacterium]|nr:YHS domain-containing (seleno)protein [Bacteroidota bacterium]
MIFSVSFFSQTNENDKRKKQFNISADGLAIEGYDPLSYFLGNPKKGLINLSYTNSGITYYFASQTNLDLFKKSPTKYEPAYGGWCAYAMGATGEKVEIDPKTYKIVEGKLYLFYNAYFNNTLPKWNKDEMNLKAKADKNWLIFYK